jgi:hypothetical protein
MLVPGRLQKEAYARTPSPGTLHQLQPRNPQ